MYVCFCLTILWSLGHVKRLLSINNWSPKQRYVGRQTGKAASISSLCKYLGLSFPFWNLIQLHPNWSDVHQCGRVLHTAASIIHVQLTDLLIKPRNKTTYRTDRMSLVYNQDQYQGCIQTKHNNTIYCCDTQHIDLLIAAIKEILETPGVAVWPHYLRYVHTTLHVSVLLWTAAETQ